MQNNKDIIESKVLKYCELKGIKLINGMVPSEHRQEVSDFTNKVIKIESKKWLKQAREYYSKTPNIINKVIGDLRNGKI